jgi:alkylation response protein AidB-like acyl-CoA dehydrogenase
MNVQLSETQEMLRTSAREFLVENCPASLVREIRKDDRGYPRSLWTSMVELGWQGLSLPERHGGSGMSFLDMCLLQEELGRACAPTPFAAVTVAALAIDRFGSDEQREAVLPSTSAGVIRAVPGLQERRDGHGTAAPLVAAPNGDGLLVSGGLDYVPWAGEAEAVLCQVAIRSSDGERRMMLLPLDAPGMSRNPLRTIGADRLWRVDADSVRVPAGAVLAGSDADSLRYTMALADTVQCCDTVGALGRVLEATVTYARERTQFGRAIGSFQVIQHYCADMHVMLEGLRMAAYAAAWSLSEGIESVRDAAVLSAYAHRVVPQILNLAHQVHGAMGVTQEHDLHLYTTRALPPSHGLLPSTMYLEAVLSA